MTVSETVSAGQLRAFIERIERVEEEIKALNGDKSDIYKELRSCGFDVKAVRQCVAARKLDSAEREERNAIFDLYWSALTGASRVHVREASQSYAEAKGVDPSSTPPHDPETGEITEPGNQSEQPCTATGPSEEAGASSDETPTTNLPETAMQSEDRSSGASGHQNQSAEVYGGKARKSIGVEPRPAEQSGGETMQAVMASAPVIQDASRSSDNFSPSPEPVSSQVKADRAGEVVSSPISPATHFDNPRCNHPDTCHLAHSEDSCLECVLAWAKLPRDEQVQRWADAHGTVA